MKRRSKLAILWFARALGLFALARRLTRGRLRILCYHGFELADETRFRPRLFMTREKFTQRLRAIAHAGGKVLGLNEALEKLDRNALPDLPVAITIDDGWHSTYQIALPALRECAFPATVYVTTYYVTKDRPIFRLCVQYMFWKTSAARLDATNLPWAGGECIDLRDPGQRNRVAWRCIEYGERLDSQDERDRIAEQLGERLEVPYSSLRQLRIMSLMTSAELVEAARQGFDIQLHTHRHRFPEDDPAAARRELDDNIRVLSPLVRSRLAHFCYPSGLWSPKCFPILAERTIASATTCEPGLNVALTPRYALRRFLDGEDVARLEFEAELSGFSDLVRSFLGRSGATTVEGRQVPAVGA